MDNVHNRLRDVRLQIDLACRRAGRNPALITLVGASKTVPATILLSYLQNGLQDVGENYVQEGLAKQRELAQLQQLDVAQSKQPDVAPRWHLIGGLQSNKAKDVVGAFSLIHSVDRVSLAKALDRAARERSIVQQVLLQVNLGNETSKSGCAPDELEALVRECALLPNIAVRGLMALPPFSEDPEAARPHFRRLRELRRLIRERAFKTDAARCMSTHAAPATWHLSMGMSNDYAVAIEEGATIIRVGTGLFGSRATREPLDN